MLYSPRNLSLSASLGLAVTIAVAVTIALQFQSLGGDAAVCLLEDPIIADPASPSFTSNVTEDDALDMIDVLEQRCSPIKKQFDSLQKASLAEGIHDLPARVAALKELRSYEGLYLKTMETVERTLATRHQDLDPSVMLSADERRAVRSLEALKSKRSATRVCFLQLVTAARGLTASLPQGTTFGCKVGLLSSLEAIAVKDAEAEGGATALAYLGAHWSELATAGRSDTALFGLGAAPSIVATPEWVRDSWGTLATSDMVYAESLFSRSNEVPGFKRPALSVLYARRLEEHAKTLEVLGQHDASVMRYRAISKLAEDIGNAALSAHALSQLSHSLKMRGAHEEAIVAAKSAVDLTMDPLAQFVLATTRLSSGLLNTDASIKAAELQLRAVAGQLPTDELEVQRAKTHSEMMMWRWVSRGDMSKCRVVPDAARFLICTLCKLIF